MTLTHTDPAPFDIDSSIPLDLKEFVESVFIANDTKGKDEELIEKYTPDGFILLPGRLECHGPDTLREWRKTAWDEVVGRKHVPRALYRKGEGELVIYGTSKPVLKDGKTWELEFVIFMDVVKTEEGWRMSRYEGRVLS